MIDDSEPVENEKAMTPITMIMQAMIRSVVLVAYISPYPTVVMVVMVQYRPIEYM